VALSTQYGWQSKAKSKKRANLQKHKFNNIGDLPAVVLLAGTEEYWLDHFVKVIIGVGVPADARDFNLDQFYASDITAAKAVEAARLFPMMAEKRVVIIKDIEKMSAKDVGMLAQYAGKPNKSTCLVLTKRNSDFRTKALKLLKESSYYIECKPLYENKIIPWLEAEVKKNNYTIKPDAASLLAMQVGTNLTVLASELEKLMLYKGDSKTIEIADVAAAAGFRKDFTIFALQNAMGERKLELALEIYGRIKNATSAQAILFQLAKFFTNILISTGFQSSQTDNAKLAKITRMHSYFVRDLHKFKQRYSVSELENALENIRYVDFSLKNFPVKETLLLQLLFVNIVKGVPYNLLPFSKEMD